MKVKYQFRKGEMRCFYGVQGYILGPLTFIDIDIDTDINGDGQIHYEGKNSYRKGEKIWVVFMDCHKVLSFFRFVLGSIFI